MKTLKFAALLTALLMISNLSFGQTAIKQYSDGNKGSVTNPSSALGTDLSNCSILKLRSAIPASESEFVSQNFIFSSAADNSSRIAFVIQLDEKLGQDKNINLKFYTFFNGQNSVDTMNMNNVQITKVNEALNLYEFSFVADKKFDTAGVMMHGGGNYRKIKIYKVYLAINNTHTNAFKFVSAKK
jgi:hypothetical protein